MRETEKAFDGAEICLVLQEWGIKNEYRLFGFDYGLAGKTPETEEPFARGVYADAGNKHLILINFKLGEKGGRAVIARAKGKRTGFMYPIRFARTRRFENRRLEPVNPLYSVLVRQGVILPFESALKKKDWRALPFEDGAGIGPAGI